MKKKLLSTGLIAGSLALALSVGAYAGANLEEVKALLNKGITIELNGSAIDLKDEQGGVLHPITYEGNTYLPVRAIATNLGLDVAWDGAANKVILSDGSTQQPQPSQPAPSPGESSTRSNPAAIGAKQSFVKESIIDNYSGSVSVDEVIRGSEAWEILSAANPYNSEPAEGNEYLLAKITISIDTIAQDGAAAAISPVDFTLVSGDGKDYERALTVVMDNEIRANLYAGASHTGWAIFEVRQDDSNPVITYARNYDGTGGVWFATK